MFAIVSLAVAGILAAIVVLIIRSRRVSAPTAETPQIVYFENKRDSFLDWLYHRTSSPEVPVQVKLRDWVDLGFYAEGGNYWGIAQQFTYYLVQGGYVYAYDTEETHWMQSEHCETVQMHFNLPPANINGVSLSLGSNLALRSTRYYVLENDHRVSIPYSY